MQEANHISALKDGCSDPRCMMKEDCKGKKVYFFSNSLKVLIYWDHKTNQKNQVTIHFFNLQSPQDLEGINCRINHDVKKNIGFVKAKGMKNLITNVTCKVNPSDKEVYVPFSFIKSYFDVSN